MIQHLKPCLPRAGQWGAFCPLFRAHGRRGGGAGQDDGGSCGRTGASNEIWNFGAEAEQAIGVVMRIREQLRRYTMGLYRAAAARGEPVMRPLFWDFPGDARSQTVEDQLMYGPEYLVAQQMVEAAASRLVYLPPLAAPTNKSEAHTCAMVPVWRNWFTGEEHNTTNGGVNVSVATPLNTFPLSVRTKSFCYPPRPPPGPAPQVICDAPRKAGKNCTMHAGTDKAGSGHLASRKCASFAGCCGYCNTLQGCGAFSFEPLHAGDSPGPSDPDMCLRRVSLPSGLGGQEK